MQDKKFKNHPVSFDEETKNIVKEYAKNFDGNYSMALRRIVREWHAKNKQETK